MALPHAYILSYNRFLTEENQLSWAKTLFAWRFSNFLIGIFMGTALAMLGVAASVEESSIWFDGFYCFAVMSTVTSIGAWWTSHYLFKRNPGTWVRKRRKRSTRKDWLRFYCLKWLGVSAFIALLVTALSTGLSLQRSKELEGLHGKLFPDNKETPGNACPSLVTEDTLLLFLGDFVAIPPSLPATILRIDNKDVMTLDRSEDGALVLSFDIRSKDGKIVARFDRGEFTINPNNILSKYRYDRSSLTILDQDGITVLDIKYLNRRAMWINAQFPFVNFKGSNTAANARCISNPFGGPILEIGDSFKPMGSSQR